MHKICLESKLYFMLWLRFTHSPSNGELSDRKGANLIGVSNEQTTVSWFGHGTCKWPSSFIWAYVL